MPKVSLPVPEIYESVSRPVAMEIVRQIMASTGLPKETPIDYLGHGDLPMPQTGSSIEDRNKGVVPVRFPSSTKFGVTVDERFWEEAPILQARLRPEHQTVFNDKDLDVYIKPVYQMTELTVTITARFTDKNSAIRWRDDIRTYLSAGRLEKLHEVSYHFPIPLEFVVILNEIYNKREAQAGYGDTIGTWLRSKLTDRHSVVTNQAGKHPTIVIKEHQIGIIGWFDFGTEPPEPEKDGEGNAYTLSFDYRVLYEKPVACAMLYPLLIHNQPVGKAFRDKKRPDALHQRPQYSSQTRSLLSKWEDGYPRTYEAYKGFSIPYWDDWLPEYTPPSTVNLMRVLLMVDPADRTNLMSLKQLGYHEFDPDALAYMEAYPEGVVKRGESVFQVHLYKRYRPQEQALLSISPDLTLRYPVGLNLRDYYHIWVGLAFDVDTLSQAARERLRQHGAFAQKLFTLLCPSLTTRGLMPALKADGSMPTKEFNDALFEIGKRRFLEGQPSVDYQNRLVGSFVVSTQKES